MSLKGLFFATAIILFFLMGGLALFKDKSKDKSKSSSIAESSSIADSGANAIVNNAALIEVDLDIIERPSISKEEKKGNNKPLIAEKSLPPLPGNAAPGNSLPEKKILKTSEPQVILEKEENRIAELFSTQGKKLPFVETITYKSRVSWQKGRPAWLSDYAAHYETSRHFIARSLNGSADYFKQDIKEGAKFNVLKQDIPLEFQLVVDASRCKMWFFAIEGAHGKKWLLKTYAVSLGRSDSNEASGLLTPLGKFLLGKRVAIYKPGVMGYHKGEKVEMITVFGTRWIPFEKEIAKTTAKAKGLGIHGVPWSKTKNGQLAPDLSSLGQYESDGCIRMAPDDIEEIFAVLLTKPAYIEIVKDYTQSDIHGR